MKRDFKYFAMVDFVKLNILNPDITTIRNNPFLEWNHLTNEKTGEVKELTTKFYSLTIEIKNNQYLKITGSLHKY